MTLKKIVFVVLGVCPFLIQLQAQETAERQANYELTDKFQDFTLGGCLILVYRFTLGELTIQIISGLSFKQHQVRNIIM